MNTHDSQRDDAQASSDPVPNAQADLQFDQAELAAPTAAMSCAACKQPVAGMYYMIGQRIFCQRCRDGVMGHLEGGSKFGRVFAALAYGLIAGGIGAAIWYGIRKATGYEIGLVAVVVGVMVGTAVRKGSRGRGGWVYQAIAMMLTYTCISVQYMPDLYSHLRDDLRTQHPATQPTDNTSSTSTASTASGDSGDSTSPAAPRAKPGRGKRIVGTALLVLLLFVGSLALPILAGFQNIIGLFILGFAVYEAWKINRRRRVEFTGPFGMTPASGNSGNDLNLNPSPWTR